MNVDQFLTMLDTAGDRLERASFKEPLDKAGEQFSQEVAGNFERQEDSRGELWKPHAPLTIKIHGEHPLLRLSYDMYRAATDLSNAAAIKRVEDRSITLGIDGTEIPYASRQDQGGGRVPQREFFYLNAESIDRVGEVLEDAAQPIIEGFVLTG